MLPTGSRLVASSLAAVFLATVALTGSAGATLSDYEEGVLKICEGVIRLFEERPDGVWPGYSLAERPFMVYVPGKWALLFNAGRGVEGFGPRPADWPDLRADVLYHGGAYGNLVGQLAFDLDVDGIRCVAIGFPESLPESLTDAELKMFGYIVHEAFHQYQNELFADTPWAREQEYPIEDGENAALAYLEMLILIDALREARDGEAGPCRESIARFVAVRDHRWQRADPFVATYEQGKEVREGTARYVELKSFDLMREFAYTSAVDGKASPLPRRFRSASMPDYLIERFGDRMGEGFVPIEDLFRNRIYPVGTAQGVLLDHMDVDWKPWAQESTGEFTYASLLREASGMDELDLPGLVSEAKSRYGFEAILTATGGEIERYLAGYGEAMAAFDAQPGRRIEVALSSNGVYRSRVSTADKWVVDRGTKSLSSHYKVYTLESDDLFLEVHEAGLFELNDFDAHEKTVAFYTPEISAITLDGGRLDVAGDAARPFDSIEMAGSGFQLKYSKPGVIPVAGDRVSVDLIRPSE
jgi:hypothetical protein